jgi:hypothetical protein
MKLANLLLLLEVSSLNKKINMKKIISYKLLSFSFFIITWGVTNGQCNTTGLKVSCTEQLANGFTYIKSYPLKKEQINTKGEIEYSFVFSRGTIYMLTFANSQGTSSDIELTLYDPNHNKITSNFDTGTGDYLPLGYKCTSTGVHYMTFKFKEGTTPCGLSILGFKRG